VGTVGKRMRERGGGIGRRSRQGNRQIDAVVEKKEVAIAAGRFSLDEQLLLFDLFISAAASSNNGQVSLSLPSRYFFSFFHFSSIQVLIG
jgi:hypothetical protein